MDKINYNSSEDKKKIITIYFGGCGGLYHYFFGIAAFLQDNFDLTSLNFHSVSGSGFPCCCLAMKVPIRQIYRLWINRKLNLIKNNNYFSLLRLFYKLVYVHTAEIGKLSEISDKDLKNWRHTVVVSPLITKNPISINNFHNADDYAHLITASAFIPLPFKGFKSWNVKTRNELYYDGMLQYNWWFSIFSWPYCVIKNPKRLSKREDSIYITTTSNNGTISFGGWLGFLYYTVIGIFTDCDWMYYRGYIDAQKFLMPQLIKIGLLPAKKNQIKSCESLLKINKCLIDTSYLLDN